MLIETWRQMFCYKISSELNIIKCGILQRSKEEIWSSAYQIDCIISIYEILMEMSQKLEEKQLQYCIQTPQLLNFLYYEWLKISDSTYKELESSLWALITKEAKCVA